MELNKMWIQQSEKEQMGRWGSQSTGMKQRGFLGKNEPGNKYLGLSRDL